MKNLASIIMLTGFILIFGSLGYYCLNKYSEPIKAKNEEIRSRTYIPPSQEELDSINGITVKPLY